MDKAFGEGFFFFYDKEFSGFEGVSCMLFAMLERLLVLVPKEIV